MLLHDVLIKENKRDLKGIQSGLYREQKFIWGKEKCVSMNIKDIDLKLQLLNGGE